MSSASGEQSTSSGVAVEDARVDDVDAMAQLPTPAPATSTVPPLAQAASSSSLSSRAPECWICFDARSTRANPMITARCRCRGSVGFVHQKCIDRWVIQQHNRTCRSCGITYRLIHTDYPPDAYLPVGSKERRMFLLRYLAVPLCAEYAEGVMCVLLRYVATPITLGLLFNAHRWRFLFGCADGVVSVPHPSPPSETAAIDWVAVAAWLLRCGPDAAATGAGGSPDSSTLGYLSAWADTFLYGLVLTLVMRAVEVGARRWNAHFRNARREHARELQAAAAAAAVPQPPPEPEAEPRAGDDVGIGADADSRENSGGSSSGPAATAMAAHRPGHSPQQHPLVPQPPVEGWRPEWGPVPVSNDFDTDSDSTVSEQSRRGHSPAPSSQAAEEDPVAPLPLRQAGEARGARDGAAAAASASSSDTATQSDEEEDSTATLSSDDTDSENENTDDDDDDDGTSTRLSFVDELFDTATWIKKDIGGGGLHRLAPKLGHTLSYGAAVTLVLRCPLGRIAVALAFLALIVGWRFFYTRNVLQSPKRRFQEVSERVPLLSHAEIRRLFVVYLIDAVFFYVALPELGAMTLHYALSPYLDIGMNGGSWLDFVYGLTMWKLTVYWCVGALLVMLLTAMELTVVSALFAHGVELFFVRSFDARWDSVLGYWRCIVTQVFDSDPPRVVYGFVRVVVVELLVLLLFVRLPFAAMLEVREVVWGDTALMTNSNLTYNTVPARDAADVAAPPRPTAKMVFSLGMDDSYDVPLDVTYEQWRRAETLRLFDQEVLMPFGAIYAKMIGSHPSLLDERNLSVPIQMDPLVAAAMMITNITAAELWADVWGNMSDHAVFLFDLIDPRSAAKVAERSEGFRERLTWVRQPLEWLRHASLRGGVCDTVTAMASPGEWHATKSQRMTGMDVEGLLTPPSVALSDPATAAARSRQMVYEAWQRAHTQASHFVPLVSRRDLLAASMSLSGHDTRWPPRSHTVNLVNCYVTALEVVQPFVRPGGGWLTAAREFIAMLLLRSQFFNHGVICVLYLMATMTALSCFAVFPLQRAQLRLLLPYVRWVGRHVVRMENFLFDPEMVRAVEDFVRTEFDEELVQPPMGDPTLFNRREEMMEDADVPTHLPLRRAVMAVLFLAAAAVMVWTVPVLCGAVMLSFTTNAIPVLLGATLLSFLIWSPALLGRAAMYGMALSVALVFALPLLLAIYVAPTLQMLWRSYPDLVEETLQRHYNVRQTVGPYYAYEGHGFAGSVLAAAALREAERAAQGTAADDDDDDDWESYDFDTEPLQEEGEPENEMVAHLAATATVD